MQQMRLEAGLPRPYDHRSLQDMLGRHVSPETVRTLCNCDEPFCFGCERKQLTVLFTDIRGFTALAEGMDPDDIGNLLNEHFTEMTEIVFRYEGMVDKFIGDGMMIVFGVPLEHADDVDRAVGCALEMQKKFEELQARWAVGNKRIHKIGLGIGIHYGEAVIGLFGSKRQMTYTAIGDTVNFASRLEKIARKGQVIVSQDFLSRLKIQVEAVELPPQEIKGKSGEHIVFAIRQRAKVIPPAAEFC